MNKKQLIKELQVLQTVQPHQSILNELKENVYQEVGVKQSVNTRFGLRSLLLHKSELFRSYRLAASGITVAVLAVIFLSILFIMPNQLHTFVLYGRLTFASNQYEKARIMLADTTNRYGRKRIDAGTLQAVTESLALTNTEMSELKLKGEDGKYTAAQCHVLYQQYHEYLKKTYDATPQSFSTLKSQITVYEEDAEKKLHMYHDL